MRSTNVFLAAVTTGYNDKIIPLHVSGTTITPGAVTNLSGYNASSSVEVLDANRFVIAYNTSSGNSALVVYTASIAGTTVTLTSGTPVVVATANLSLLRVKLIDTNRSVFTYKAYNSAASPAYALQARVVTYSGTVITINSNVTTLWSTDSIAYVQDCRLWKLSATSVAIIAATSNPLARLHRAIMNIPAGNAITASLPMADFGYDFYEGAGIDPRDGLSLDTSGDNRAVLIYRGYLATAVYSGATTLTLRVSGMTPLRDRSQYASASVNPYFISGLGDQVSLRLQL